MPGIDDLNRTYEQTLQRHLDQQAKLKEVADRSYGWLCDYMRADFNQIAAAPLPDEEQEEGKYRLPLIVNLDDQKQIHCSLVAQSGTRDKPGYRIALRTPEGGCNAVLPTQPKYANQSVEEAQRESANEAFDSFDMLLSQLVARRFLQLRESKTLGEE